MRKITNGLKLKLETIRTLDGMRLGEIRGGGGGDVAVADTGHGTGCPGKMAIPSENGGDCPGRA